MKKFGMGSNALLMLVAGLTFNASAAVLTFDDVGTTSEFAPIYSGYGGFSWDNMYYHSGYLPASGYGVGAVSGSFTAFNANAEIAVTSSVGTFDFNGAYLTGAWNDGLSVNVKGYAAGSLLYDTTVVTSATNPTWFQFDYQGVDSLVFSAFGGTQYWAGGSGTHFAMDNFTINAVPVPASVWLLGSGLIGLLGVARSKTRS